MAEPFTSEIRLFPYAASRFIPTNWALCDGSLLDVEQFKALFSLIGTRYGGDGVINFKLPDLRGRAPMQPGQAPDLSPHSLGETGGGETVTLNTNQIPHHRHETKVLHDEAQQSDPAGAYLGYDNAADVKVYESYSTGHYVNMSSRALATAGAGHGHENRQPFLALHFCIALNGDYPPRPD
ncbi:MAG: tail fiber protein [Victivallaceae bacterium]|nr:tail fiber protein [Victivallaceae bacterium]